MVGSRRSSSSLGGGESSSRATNEDSEDEQGVGIDPSVIVRPDLQILDPAVYWFDEPAVVENVVGSIKAHFPKFSHSWNSTDPAIREMWWKIFKHHYGYYKTCEPMVRVGWEAKAKERFKDLIYRATIKAPDWFLDPVKQELEEYKVSPEYLVKSAKAKANRRSQGEDGKAAATHTLGRSNMLRLMNKMASGCSNPPTAAELMKRSKTSKKKEGRFITKKAKDIFEKYEASKAELQESGGSDGVAYDDNEIYYKAAEGYDNKGRVYGIGNATPIIYYKNPMMKSTGKSAAVYTPVLNSMRMQGNVLSDRTEMIVQENVELKERMSQMEARERERDAREKEREAQMNLLLSYLPTPLCNPRINPFPDWSEEGGGSGGTSSCPISNV